MSGFDPETRKPRSRARHEIVPDQPRKVHDRFEWEKQFRGAPLPHVVKAIGFAAATWGGRNGRDVRPGVAQLANDFLLDEKTIRRHLETLEATGWLVLVARARRVKDAWLCAVYHLAVPASHDYWTNLSSDDDQTELSSDSDDNRTDLSGDGVAPELTTGQSTNDHRTNLVAPLDKIVRTPCINTKYQHQEEPPPTPSQPTAPRADRGSRDGGERDAGASKRIFEEQAVQIADAYTAGTGRPRVRRVWSAIRDDARVLLEDGHPLEDLLRIATAMPSQGTSGWIDLSKAVAADAGSHRGSGQSGSPNYSMSWDEAARRTVPQPPRGPASGAVVDAELRDYVRKDWVGLWYMPDELAALLPDELRPLAIRRGFIAA